MKKNRLSRLTALLLSIVLALGTLTGAAFAADFPDAPRSQWYGDAVYACVEKGYVKGFEDGSFRPGNAITYAQLASMLRGGVYADTSYAAQAFPSMPWWYASVYTCRQMGALEGIAAKCDASDVNNTVSRYEMALVISNVMASKGLTVSSSEKQSAQAKITDWASVPAKYRDAVASCYALGIISGFTDGSFGGAKTLTRAQVCVVMVNMDEAIAKPRTKVGYGEENYPDLTSTDYGVYRKLDYCPNNIGRPVYFYHFKDTWHCGVTNPTNRGLTESAGFFGITAKTDKNGLTYEAYTETDNATIASVEFQTYDGAQTIKLDTTPNEPHTYSTNNLENGPYSLYVRFEYKDDDGNVKNFANSRVIYVSDGQGWFADTYTANWTDAAMEKWLASYRNEVLVDDAFQDWMAQNGGNNIDAALRLDNITYPFYSNTEKYPNETSKWRELAHEICPDEDAGDFTKAHLLHEWISHNMVYDLRQIEDANGNQLSKFLPYRWAENGGGEWTPWKARIGVCFDFSNIYAIMCRELGVPCRIVADKSIFHCYNAVYLRGRWELVDLTASTGSCYIENTLAALQKFWDSWEGSYAPNYALGFIVPASSKYKELTYQDEKPVEEKFSDFYPLDYDLCTKSLLQRFGPLYNH